MANLTYQHQDLASGRWAKMPIAEQLANIGSEISRATKAQRQNKPERAERAFFRALELFDLSIYAAKNNPAHLRELCRAREEVCDYFAGDNTFHTDIDRLQRYYDQFAVLIHHQKAENQ